MKHYLQVTDKHFRQAAQEAAQKAVQPVSAATCQNAPAEPGPKKEPTSAVSGQRVANTGKDISNDMVGDTGLEPVTSCVSSRRSSQSELIALQANNSRIPDRAKLSTPFRVSLHRVSYEGVWSPICKAPDSLVTDAVRFAPDWVLRKPEKRLTAEDAENAERGFLSKQLHHFPIVRGGSPDLPRSASRTSRGGPSSLAAPTGRL